MASGDLISRMYSNFRGVDFRGEEINLARSPDSLNVWRNYKKTESISTRPSMVSLPIVDEEKTEIIHEKTTVYGVYFYNDEMIVHCDTRLYKVVNGVATVLYSAMPAARGEAFIFNNLWYFKDGQHYLQYDGETIRNVHDVAYIPTTTIGRKAGAMSGGTVHEDVNMLSDYRINTFTGDGDRDAPVGKGNFYLDVPEINNVYFTSSKDVWDVVESLKNREEFLLNLTIDGKPIMEKYEDEDGNMQTRYATFVDANGDTYSYDVYFYKNGTRIAIDGTTNLEEIGKKGGSYGVLITKNIAENTCVLSVYYRASAGTYPVSISYKDKSDEEYTKITLSTNSLPFEIVGNSDDTWCCASTTLDNCDFLSLNSDYKIVINETKGTFHLFDKTSELSEDASGTTAKYVGGNGDFVMGAELINKLRYSDTLDGRIQIVPAPPVPLTDGQDNVSIRFKKANADKLKINNCTLLQVFDNRVFFSGNPNYPNMMWHSSLNDPTYCSDLDYYNEGLDRAEIKGMIAGNNALWVFKEPSQANTSIFYHTPSTDLTYGKIYPNAHSSISTGCVGKAINFNDDIVFFSDRGMEGISGDITSEQVVAHRSSLVDRKLLEEKGYKDMLLEEWEGYLLVFIGKKVYLADSRAMFANENHGEYEWFYWELEKDITCVAVDKGTLYLGTKGGVYTLTDFEGALTDGTDKPIESYWVTPKDKFKHPQYLKTTNKRGCVVEATGDVTVYAKTENTDFELIGEYKNVTDAFVSRIKRKKFKDIQLKFHSNTRFSVETSTLECFIGGYVKR